MTNHKHTPGPWINAGSGFINKARLVDHEDGLIEIYGSNREANARLITAAPELLEAALAAVAALSQPALYPADAEAAKVWLNAAIAKARGQ